MDKSFIKKLGISEDELLNIVRKERQEWEDFSYNYKLEIEADLKLLKNKRDKKKDEKLVWDSTLFNIHTALIARSFQSKNQIRLKGDKNWSEREVKMLNEVLNEDLESPEMKALRYYVYHDKFATWLGIVLRNWWDGIYKRNKFSVINPLTWVPDPNWDYFTGNYRYTWFFTIKTKEEIREMWFDPEELVSKAFENGAIDQKERMQRLQWLYPNEFGKELFDVYYHFTCVGEKKIWIKTANIDSLILDAGFVLPNSPLEEKEEEWINFPLAFYYWKPDRDNPFGDRPANYTRDVQLQKAEISNLRLNKMRAELYPMYLYNKDYVSMKDLSFGFNKWVPVSTWIDWASVNLNNIVQPIQKDLKIDTSFAVEQSLDRQVEKSTSIGEVVQWTTPTKRETLGTNNLIQSNTDVNLSLNEEIHAIGDDQFVRVWFGWYYQNFASWDKKLVYAWSSTGKQAIILKRKDFIYEWNLNISIESNIQSEDRKRKESAAAMQISPLLLPSLSNASKIKYLRFMADRSWIPAENVEEFLIDTPQMALQAVENELLKMDIYVPINPDDVDEDHLVEMWSTLTTKQAEIHKMAHIQAMIAKWTMPSGQSQWLNESSMANSMASQAMSQAWSQLNQ